jgi:hypothetical protein
MARDWCVLPVDSTKKQRERFRKCLNDLGECDLDADTNGDGDLLISCEN